MTVDHEGAPARYTRQPRLGVLIAATTANYLWQVPYAVHQYGWTWTALPQLSAGLLLSGAWFAVAAHRFLTARRFGRAMLVVFLVVESSFYLLHNLSGAFLADLPVTNPVVAIASVLGYVNMVVALVYLWLLGRNGRGRSRDSGGRDRRRP